MLPSTELQSEDCVVLPSVQMCPGVVRLFELRAIELFRCPGIRPPPPGDTPVTQTSGRPADAEQDASRWQNWKHKHREESGECSKSHKLL